MLTLSIERMLKRNERKNRFIIISSMLRVEENVHTNDECLIFSHWENFVWAIAANSNISNNSSRNLIACNISEWIIFYPTQPPLEWSSIIFLIQHIFRFADISQTTLYLITTVHCTSISFNIIWFTSDNFFFFTILACNSNAEKYFCFTVHGMQKK